MAKKKLEEHEDVKTLARMDSSAFAEKYRGFVAVVPEMVKLEPGDVIEGLFEGYSEYEAADAKTGEVKKLIGTILRTGPESHETVRLTDSFKMRQSFGTKAEPGAVPLGARVVVYREEDVNTKKGTRMSDIRVLYDPNSVVAK